MVVSASGSAHARRISLDSQSAIACHFGFLAVESRHFLMFLIIKKL